MGDNEKLHKDIDENKELLENANETAKKISKVPLGSIGKIVTKTFKIATDISETVGNDVILSKREQENKFYDQFNNAGPMIKYDETETTPNPQPSPQLQTEQNSQIQAFIPQNLTQSEISEINEALEKYHITKQADKDTYLWDLDDKKPLFKGYIKNWFDALEKFTKNSDISAASNDFDKAVKQQENTLKELKEQLSFTEKNAIIRVFASKFHNVKTLENKKERVGVAMPKYYLDIISDYKRQIVRNFGEKIWQETFNKFEKTNDLKVFENAVKSPLSQQNANLQISNENANLKNPNLQNSAGNANSENNATNLQNLNNDFKM